MLVTCPPQLQLTRQAAARDNGVLGGNAGLVAAGARAGALGGLAANNPQLSSLRPQDRAGLGLANLGTNQPGIGLQNYNQPSALAAALGSQQTAQLMEDDILTTPIPITDRPRWGRIDKPGLGVEVDEDKLMRYHEAYLRLGDFPTYAGKVKEAK